MRLTVASSAALACILVAASACRSFQNAMAPAAPTSRRMPAVGEIPDTILLKVIQQSELIVLAVPQDLIPADALSPSFQLGAKETWYNVKLTVDSVVKGKLGHAKVPDYGVLPAVYTPPWPFYPLAPNEIVVQYPAVTTLKSDWAAAPPPVVGERAVYLFRRCWYCITIGLATGRGTYKANPLVAAGWGSKLDAAEWPRVRSLIASVKRSRK